MNVDPFQIMQVTLYSKLMNDGLTNVLNNETNVWVAVLVLFFYKLITDDYLKYYIRDLIDALRANDDESAIVIPQHKRSITCYSGGTSRENVQIVYSKRFRALNHYMHKNCPANINKMIEVINKSQKSLWDDEIIDFILLPIQNEKILIHKDLDIFFEINITEEEEREKENDKKAKMPNVMKNYVYKITKKGKDKYQVLQDFLDKCVVDYENEIVNKKEQQTFEYIKSTKDEDDRHYMDFRAYPFKSNKHLDKNIFFEGRDDFIKYVDRFSNRGNKLEKDAHERRYEDAGITFKAGIIMTGPPGCGKSSTIRGILNRTGRHGVLVRWSSIKTCNEFCNLIRSTVIKEVKYEMKELCFIFEDFDANNDEILKKRSEKATSICCDSLVNDDDSDICSSDVTPEGKTDYKKSKKMLETMTTALLNANKGRDDELTLECVLNVIDGIVELHDAMLIFTTNHLEKIDPAFTRPGRIDYVLDLKLASVLVIKEMVEYKYREENLDMKKYDPKFALMKDYVISPAQVQVTCLKYKEHEIEDCLDELIVKTNPS